MQAMAPASLVSVRVVRTIPLLTAPPRSGHLRVVPALTSALTNPAPAPSSSRRSAVCTATTDNTNKQTTSRSSTTSTTSPEPSPVPTSSASSLDTSSGAAPKASTFAKIKAFGIAGTLSYVVTEIAFWAVALPGAYLGYHQSTGQWLSLDTDKAQLVGMAAAFVTGVRFAVPLRMAAAMALVPTMQRLLQKPEDR